MTIKKIDDDILSGIADSIRGKLNVQTTYKPSEMADAIDTIEGGGYPEPTGTKTITANGTGIDVKDYASADVAVPNSYSSSDEGKVVDNGALVSQTSQTVTQNGTYDTTLKNEVVVNVSGGGGGSYPVTDAIYDEDITGYTIYAEHALDALLPASQTIASAISDYFTIKLADLNGTAGSGDVTIELTKSMAQMTASAFEQAGYFDAKGAEYSGCVYGNSMISELGLVLLGDFSNTGAATGNVLSDSINNYSGVILQGIYKAGKTSNYNTSCLYQDIELNTQYWAGMKDRNNSYKCNVTFTDDTTVSLSGNKQVLIYGIL